MAAKLAGWEKRKLKYEKYAEKGKPEKLEKAGYVMRLAGGAGNIRPRAATPQAQPGEPAPAVAQWQ